MKVAVLYSGGKDSCLTTWYALHQGWEVTTLIAVISRNPDSFMFHTPNISWTGIQAKAMNLPIATISTQGIKEEELLDLEKGITELSKEDGFEGLLSGAIQSEYQRTRIDRVCEHIGIPSYTPLWCKDPLMLLEEEVDLGFRFILSACAAKGLTQEWLGRNIDEASLKDLRKLFEKFRINPAFEGGEAETFVTDAPNFKKRIKITKAEERWNTDRGEYIIKKAELAEKNLTEATT